MGNQEAPKAKRGWYEVPSEPKLERFWDGSQWDGQQRLKRRKRFLRPITYTAVSVVLLLVVGGFVLNFLIQESEKAQQVELEKEAEAAAEAKAARHEAIALGQLFTSSRCIPDSTLSPDKKSLSFTSIFLSLPGVKSIAIDCVLDTLEAPASLANKMKITRAIDGIQEEIWGDYRMEYTYHPDSGFNVVVEYVKP